MRIKTKLNLAVGFLFTMIILLSLVGALYINALKNDSQNILVANFNSLEYSRNMILALDEKEDKKSALISFELNLKKQENNVTEIGEQEVTDKLHANFIRLKDCSDTSCMNLLYPIIRQDISEIMELNLQAIQRKSDVAKNTASSATFWIVLTGTICFIIAFTLLINLPQSISNPIKELTESIKEIAAENYTQRVNFESHSEFGELAKSFNTMAAKLSEYNDSNLFKLLLDKKRIETLINNMHDPVIGIDENMKILFANNEAIKILGIDPVDLIGKFAQDVSVFNDLIRSLTQDLMVEFSDKLKNTSSQKKPLKIFSDNKESYFEKEIINITITPTGEKIIQNIGYVIILKNITPFKELDFAKTNFIATVSHELKTPISSIKMSLKLLEKKETGNTNDEQKQLIHSILEDSDRLLKITGELLNLSQVETGNIQLNIQQSSPYQILQYATEAIRVSAEQKQIEIIIDTEEKLPNVKADTEKTAWVLINFLTNAIRYSPNQSKIRIGAKLKMDIKSDTKNTSFSVIFSVKDSGIGIDSRYRDKIFDRYFQVPGSARSGTGLGLSISKEFIEAQNGEIGVESEIGSGSTFFFTLQAN